MRAYVAIGVSIVLFVSVSSVMAATTGAVSCLEEDRGYQLIKADRSIDPVRLYGLAVKKFTASNLNGWTEPRLHQFGVTTGDAREWARLFVMMCKQESGCRIARTYVNGALEKFPSTLQGENSYGPMQFNIGEYGLNSWAMVNSPACTIDAYIRVAQQNNLFKYFGSMQRPNETLQHANWFNTTVQPFADALRLSFDPNAPNVDAFRAVAPYLTNGYASSNAGLLGSGSPFGYNQSQQIMQVSTGQGATASGGTSGTTGGGLQTTPGTNTDLPGANSSPTPGPGVATLVVQAQSVRRGNPVLVAWSTLGMKTDPTCRLLLKLPAQAESEVAQGNGGARPVAIPISAQAGTGEVVLRCNPIVGPAVEKRVSFTVE